MFKYAKFYWFLLFFFFVAVTSASGKPLAVEVTKGERTLWDIAFKYTLDSSNYNQLLDAKTGKPFREKDYRRLRAKTARRAGTMVLIPEELLTTARLETKGKTLEQICGSKNDCPKLLQKMNRFPKKATALPSEIRIPLAMVPVTPVEIRRDNKRTANPGVKVGKKDSTGPLPYLIALIIALTVIALSSPKRSFTYFRIFYELLLGTTKKKLIIIQQDLIHRLHNSNSIYSYRILPTRSTIMFETESLDFQATIAELCSVLQSYSHLEVALQPPRITFSNRPRSRSPAYAINFGRGELARWRPDKMSLDDRRVMTVVMQDFAERFFEEFCLPHRSNRNFIQGTTVTHPETKIVELWISPGEGHKYPSLKRDGSNLISNLRDAMQEVGSSSFTLLEGELREETFAGTAYVVVPIYYSSGGITK